MRHQKAKMNVRKKNGFCKFLYTNLLKSLFFYGNIKTTLKRGMILSRMARKVFGNFNKKKDAFNKKRYLFSVFKDFKNVEDFFKYKKFTVFLIKCIQRNGDQAPMAVIKLQ